MKIGTNIEDSIQAAGAAIFGAKEKQRLEWESC
jgi:hypothetical protein